MDLELDRMCAYVLLKGGELYSVLHLPTDHATRQFLYTLEYCAVQLYLYTMHGSGQTALATNDVDK